MLHLFLAQFYLLSLLMLISSLLGLFQLVYYKRTGKLPGLTTTSVLQRKLTVAETVSPQAKKRVIIRLALSVAVCTGLLLYELQAKNRIALKYMGFGTALFVAFYAITPFLGKMSQTSSSSRVGQNSSDDWSAPK